MEVWCLNDGLRKETKRETQLAHYQPETSRNPQLLALKLTLAFIFQTSSRDEIAKARPGVLADRKMN